MSNALLIHGGPILTMDVANPLADAVGIVNGRITAVGSREDILATLGGRYETIDLDGRMATPGLYDAHAHIMGVGGAQALIDISPTGVSSIEDIRAAVMERSRSVDAGAWIVAQGFDQALLAENRIPTRQDLDDISPDHPVVLQRSCHHIMTVNSAALRAAGIDVNTPDPDDGAIDRDEHGEPTGVLRESAMNPVHEAMPELTEDDYLRNLQLGGLEFRRHGITSAAEAGIGNRHQLRAYQRAHGSGTLALRTWIMMLIDDTLDELIELGIMTGFGDDWMRIGNAKLYTDGSIGGRTARLSEPYVDEENNVGLWMYPPEQIREKLLRAHTAGFQLGNHAIGDAAISLLLDVYEEAQRLHPVDDFRPRIEHCSIVSEPMLERVKQIGAVPIPGTTFMYDFMAGYIENLGKERIRYAYAMNTFDQRGIVAAASTDAPVCVVNPMVGVQFMLTRVDRTGHEIYREESVSLEQAIRAYTWNGAYASHQETVKGSLEPGKLGDIAVFETDLRDVDPVELRNVRCDFTIADGHVVYDRMTDTNQEA